MTEPYINKGRLVYPNPTIPGEGGVVLDPAIAVPEEYGLQVNGAPVIEKSHEYVIRKKPK